MNHAFVRQDGALDRRVGASFWLAPDIERNLRRQYLTQVQSLAGRSVSDDDFHVRGMLVANSQRDYYYSRFSREALAEAAELAHGAPVMYGHDYGSVPAGRIFNARVTRIENPDLDERDQHWLEALYYVPRDAEGDAHVRRVDLGIFREVSFGWRCASQTCSVCGDSIQRCSHIPGDIYENGFCEYEFGGITAALEVSHVFRGGQKDTSTFVPADPAANGESPSLAAGRFMRACPPGSLDVDPAMLIAAKRFNGALVSREYDAGNGVTINISLEDWLASDTGRHARDFFSFGQPGMRADVQSVRVDMNRFTSLGGAKRWARDHDFRVDRMRTARSEVVFEQQAEANFQSDGFREVALDRGVHAVIGKRDRNKERKAENKDAEPLESWLSESASKPATAGA